MQMKSVVSLGDGEAVWCADLGPLEYSFCISSDYSSLDHFMKTEQQQKLIQLKPVNVGSFSYTAFASTVLLLLTCFSRIWLCATLKDCNLPGSSIQGILWAIVLEWVAMPFSGDLSDPGIKPGSLALQTDSLLLKHQGSSSLYCKQY